MSISRPCPYSSDYEHCKYEKYYGEIPKGYWIYHLDGNVSNNSIDNLIALERSIVASLNITGLKSTDKELTKLGIDILKINRKVKERKRWFNENW